MLLMNQVNLLFIWMQRIYMVRQWANIFPLADLNG